MRSKRRSRRFVRRNRWRIKKKALKRRRCKLQGKPTRLVFKLQDHILTEDQKALLNKGPNLCHTRDSVNKIEVKVS